MGCQQPALGHEPHRRNAAPAQERLLQTALAEIDGPVILVAHSAGVMITVNWAQMYDRPIYGAMLAAPADVEVRAFDRASDWDALLALSLTIDPDTPAMRAFLTQRIAARARAAARGQVRWA